MKCAAILLAILSIGVTAHGEEPCENRCKDVVAGWDWKANGYALAGAEQDAAQAATEQALASGCKASEPYVAARKLKCKGSCTAGQETRKCAPSKEPTCSQGTFTSDEGMWKFVCMKFHNGAAACDEAEAQKNPAWSTCEVFTRLEKTLPCSSCQG